LKKGKVIKKIILIIVIQIVLILKSCGLPSPDSISVLNTPAIVVGTKTASGSYFNYSKVEKFPGGSPPYIRISIMAYQPEPDFSGFNIYINNSIDLEPGFDDGTKASIQWAHQYHYNYDTSKGTYPNQQRIEARFIIASQSGTSGLYPSISVSQLSLLSVYPAMKSYPVEFKIEIRWDGRGQQLTYGEKIYNIAVSAVDVASKIESKLSNIIKVRFTSNPLDGDPNYDL
jgi:hypothetical protein